MAYSASPISHVSGGATAGAGFTTASMNSTGADTIFVAVNTYIAITDPPTLTDSKGNSYTILTSVATGADTKTRIYYKQNAVVGSGHTFTLAGSTTYGALAAAAFSGGHLSSLLDTDGSWTQVAGSATSINISGGITPSVDNCIVITALGRRSVDNETSAISGFTITDEVAQLNGDRVGVALAFKIQTTAGNVDPTFTWATVDAATMVTASFKAAAGGGGSSVVPIIATQQRHRLT